MPTVKQQLAAKKTLENHGNVSKAMRESGYSRATSKNPKTLTTSKGWKALMKKHLPNENLAKKHKELLGSTIMLQMHFPEYSSDKEIREIIEKGGNKLLKTVISEVTYPGKKGKEDITVTKKIAYYCAPNGMVQDKALDKAYKLKGLYSAEKREVRHQGISLRELFEGRDPDKHEESDDE